ncbi:hypothetical protein LR69_03461 [Geobacillus sp. BCO2]|nr:hypothetical protein LR69_03461 [Geobacillus sp. BCO2]
MFQSFSLRTTKRDEMVEITSLVEETVRQSGVEEGWRSFIARTRQPASR